MSFRGYINKRHSPISPPSMVRVYCVLWGTLLLDYESEEDAVSCLIPKNASEVLGVSEWDGQGRANQYPNGILIMTHTGGEYYLSTTTETERDEWIFHVRRALECHFANPSVTPFKPSKIIQTRPPPVHNIICPKTKEPMGPADENTHKCVIDKNNTDGTNNCRYKRFELRVKMGLERSDPPFEAPESNLCRCCGRGFSSSEYVSLDGPAVVQVGAEESEKMCAACVSAQALIIWLKTVNYTHVSALHNLTQEVLKETKKFKASFRLRRRDSERLDMAAQLLDQGNISYAEFQELRQVDEDYRREVMLEEAERLRAALDALGSDVQTIISILMNPKATEKGGAIAYHFVILKLLEIADSDPELLDFYWPQIIHVHLQEASSHTQTALTKVDELQQAMLVLSLKFPQLGTKLAWALFATLEDYTEKRVSRTQHAACLSLLLQLEMIVTGDISSLADLPTCSLLAEMLPAVGHQQQEISYEISVLFLARRKLQESYEEEMVRRVQRKGIIDQNREEMNRERTNSGARRRSFGGKSPVTSTSTSVTVTQADSAAETSSPTVDTDRPIPATEGLDPESGAEGEGKASDLSLSLQIDDCNDSNDSNNSPETAERAQDRQMPSQSRVLINGKTSLEIGISPVVVTPVPDVTPVTPVKAKTSVSMSTDVYNRDNRGASASPNMWRSPDRVAPSPGSCVHMLNGLGVGPAAEPAPSGSTPRRRHSESGSGKFSSSGKHSHSQSQSDREREREREMESLVSDKDNEMFREKAPLWGTFGVQLDFMHRLAELVDSLRWVDRPERTKTLKDALDAWEGESASANGALGQNNIIALAEADGVLGNGNFGWDPTSAAGEPMYRITRVLTKECRVFRTKARAPSMVVCEVVRDDVFDDIASVGLAGYLELAAGIREEEEERDSIGIGRDRERDSEGGGGGLGNSQGVLGSVSSDEVDMRRISRGGYHNNNPHPSHEQHRLHARNRTRTSSADVEMLLSSGSGPDSVQGPATTASQMRSLVLTEGKGREGINISLEQSLDSFDEVGGLVDSNIEDAIGKIHHLQEEEEKKHQKKEEQKQTETEIEIGAGIEMEMDGEKGKEGGRAVSQSHSQSQSQPSLSKSLSFSKSSTQKKGFLQRKAGSGQLLSQNRKNTQAHSSNFQALLNSGSSTDLSLTADIDMSSEMSMSGAVSTVVEGIANLPLRPPVNVNNINIGMPVDGEFTDSSCDTGEPSTGSDTSPSHSSGNLKQLNDYYSNTDGRDNSPIHKDRDKGAEEKREKSYSNSEGLVEGGDTMLESGVDSISLSQNKQDAPSNGTLGGSDPLEGHITGEVLSSAKRLLLMGKIDEEEYKQLLLSDLHFRKETEREHAVVADLQVAGQVESSFGELWATKKKRVLSQWKSHLKNDRFLQDQPLSQSQSQLKGADSISISDDNEGNGNEGKDANTMNTRERVTSVTSDDYALALEGGNHDLDSIWPPVDLRCFIVKSNDDLRQEMAVLQLMRLCKEIFADFGLQKQLFLRPYRIVGTGSTTGVVEVLTDTLSLDALKKTPGFVSLPDYFNKTYGSSPERLLEAKKNFTASLAAYSVFSYILLIKDRHNGNILIDTEGHIIHIDFGFLLSIAPGGAFSLETAPFKLTEEMIEVMDGLESPLFGEFVKAFTTGFLALRTDSENFLSALQVLSIESPFPCFAQRDQKAIIEKLRGRFRADLSVKDFVQHCLDLIISSYGHYGTRQYDSFQYYTNGIEI